jgi:hypothetical protein
LCLILKNNFKIMDLKDLVKLSKQIEEERVFIRKILK